MARILLFGGLTYWGSQLTDRLLAEGNEVIVPYHRYDEEAVERSLLFGRNALFKEIVLENTNKTEWVGQDLNPDVLILFDGVEHEETDLIVNPFTKCIAFMESLQKVIVLSHIAIYGAEEGIIDEQAKLTPKTSLGERALQLECSITSAIKKEETHTKSVLILRIPALSDAITPESNDCTLIDCIHIQDLIDAIQKGMMGTIEEGVHVIQVTSGKWFSVNGKRICYPYKKAECLLGFKPKYRPVDE
ncbi:hypothetical protein GCM10011391_32360 [Pullulanibacillus camelliae]|uniref:Uncharacterized protein n=1 Tax=Pullulanibacillus camelliae TaxID=1707096 RepID=A0A8J2YLC5_9BACL|nr:hypothetical protein [Pullulanibacillus camelliae]GGE51099.1 hypothetical protein GCM10011391_32360 [Pullulanibacillus camelliae]